MALHYQKLEGLADPLHDQKLTSPTLHDQKLAGPADPLHEQKVACLAVILHDQMLISHGMALHDQKLAAPYKQYKGKYIASDDWISGDG